ncbi:synaptotagmin-like protein 2 [Clupea harengus]|uniref:Synaptotagmin-like protein 2 n=1 Tax=Clupea harengus TaxID=7950 RepID=A0A8M1KKP5_CLUHA|nr:synaptotagmin-like protein 2 [Clupea harengus]
MIDLTYLTEEEKEMIMAVLKRDADLKSKEDQRVKELQKTSRDRNKIKYLTGEWFYETKSQRHRDRIHGSDIIRASIRQRKPVTIFELSKVWAENLTFGKIGNPDVFIPPELPGLIEEPPAQSETQSREYAGSPESQPDGLKPAVQAQAKQRQNPFNNTPLSPVSSDKTSRLVSNGAPQAEKAPAGVIYLYCVYTMLSPHHCCLFSELLPSYESPIDTLTNQTSESSETLQATLNVLKPLPRKRVLRVSQDSSTESNACKQGATPAPRSILKQNSSSSSSDSLPPHSNYSPEAEPLSPLILPDSPSLWSSFADRKQVRFSAIIRGRNPALQNGQERGDLLDQDSIALSDEEGQTDRSDTSGSSSSSNSSSSGDGSSDGLRGECESPVFSETLQRTDPELYISPKSVPQDSYSWNSKLVIHEEVKSVIEVLTISFYQCLRTIMPFLFTGFHDCLAEPPASEVSHLHSTAPETGKSENTSAVRIMLKRANSRPMSFSKSLEDITTMPNREERMRTDQKSDLVLSVDDVSVVPSSPASPNPEQMKRMSASVPAFLQQEVSGSVMSIYSGDFSSVEVKGTIQFAMNYVEKLGEFHIFVVQCRDLAVAEPKRNRSDPYVKCYLLPDKAKLGKRKTSVKKKTLNPTFNEILRYKISSDTLRTATLNLSVWHHDSFGRNSFLGEADVDLREWNFIDSQMKDYLLRPRVVSRPKTTDQKGDMRVALRFLPQSTQSKRASKTGEVQICVRECKNLPVVRGVIIDPFVKCTVLPDASRKSRQKTRVAKKTADPVFNHTMVYDGFKQEDLQEACAELTVWDHDRLNNHFLGGLRLGPGTGKSYGSEVDWMDSTTEEATLWGRMLISQGEWVEDVLPLRMLMMAK